MMSALWQYLDCELVRKDMDVNEDEKISNITHRHNLII